VSCRAGCGSSSSAESDVHAAGWPDAVAGDLDEDVAVFENPDPRGPCGGAVPQAPLEGSVARSFSTPDTVVIELVVVNRRAGRVVPRDAPGRDLARHAAGRLGA
jgi:hypothetical protein